MIYISVGKWTMGWSYIFYGLKYCSQEREDQAVWTSGRDRPPTTTSPWRSCSPLWQWTLLAASQNARSGSTPKTHRRSRPPIQTFDPDRSRPHDPDLWSRPLCFMLVGHVLFQSTEKYYVLCTTKYYSSTTLYYKVLLCTTKYDAGWSREFWKNLAIPFQTSFQTVPDPFQTSSMESKGSVHSQPCCPRRKNRSVRPVQNHLIQFKSYMKWLSWFQALRSRRAEKTFYESGFQTSGSSRNDPDPFIDPCPFASRKISIVIGWSLTPVEQMSLKDRQTGGLKVVKVWLEEICLQELWGWWTPAFVGQRLKGLLLLQSNRTGWRDGGFLRVQVCLDLILGASCLGIHGTCTVDGAEIRQAPVEVGSLSHYLQGFIYPKRCRISSINSMFIYV